MSKDELYLRRCLELARLGGTAVQTNPRVGSVIVHGDRIIGEGWHERYGEGHGEVKAVASVAPEDLHLLSEATIYVSLEPCNHVGKTPACTSLILKHQIPVVVVGSVDPNPKMAGKSLEFLRSKGLEVRLASNQLPFQELNRPFFVNQQLERPYVVLKWAESADGYIAGLDPQGQPMRTAITGPKVKKMVHRLRTELQAILVGRNTALIDDPSLTARKWPGASPLRLVLSGEEPLPHHLSLFRDGHPNLILGSQQPAPSPTTTCFQTEEGEELSSVLERLYTSANISSILVEGGAAVLNSFIEAGIFDEIYRFTAHKNLGNGVPAPQLPSNLSGKKSNFENGDQLNWYRRGGSS